MNTPAEHIRRSIADLAPAETRALSAALLHLRDAARSALVLGDEPHEDDLSSEAPAARAAYDAIDVAEDRYWQLRWELLGEGRPSWALRARHVADWFSEEDSVYDTVSFVAE